jgi:hypothetical protein
VWQRRERARTGLLMAVIAIMHLISFGALIVLVARTTTPPTARFSASVSA